MAKLDAARADAMERQAGLQAQLTAVRTELAEVETQRAEAWPRAS